MGKRTREKTPRNIRADRVTEADLYIRMWRTTRDPKYITLFRKAMTQQASKWKWSTGKTPYEMLRDSHIIPPIEELEEEVSKRTESSGETMDENEKKHAEPKQNMWGPTLPPMVRMNDPLGKLLKGRSGRYKEQSSPDGKTWTLDEILEELK